MWRIKSIEDIKNSYDENEDFDGWFKEVEQIAGIPLDDKAADTLIAFHKTRASRWPNINVELTDGLVVLSQERKRDDYIPIDMRDVEEYSDLEF